VSQVKPRRARPVPLPSGRLLRPGQTADVDLADPEIAAAIRDGSLNVLDDKPHATVDDTLDWVGTDAERAHSALTAELAREEGDQRKTLVTQLRRIAGDNKEA
jgi:hypothetical protein